MLRLRTITTPLLAPWRTLELKPAVILLSAAVLLTVYRYYGRRQFFRGLLSEHLVEFPFRSLIPFFGWYLFASIPLLIIPICLIRWVFREPLRDYGVQVGNARWGLSFVALAYVLMVPILLIVAQWPSFQGKYPLFQRYYQIGTLSLGTRCLVLIAYELAYGCYFVSWEFFFRGFMLYGLESRFGIYSIFIQTIPFAIMHYGKPFPEAMGAVFTGILLGLVGLHTRSFWYAFLVHWLVALSMDMLALGMG